MGGAWVELGALATIVSGNAFPRRLQGDQTGDFPFYKVSDMNLPGNETFMFRANNYLSVESAGQLRAKPVAKNSVLFPKVGAALATNKKRMTVRSSLIDNNIMAVIPGENLNPRFLHHYLNAFDLVSIAHQHGAVPSIRKTEVERIRIPMLDMREQVKLSNLLDRFDALVNDLSSGLPAEIEARRKQYEYYRDKLLTFKELEPEAA